MAVLDRSAAAHLLRRTTLVPSPSRVEELTGLDVGAALDSLATEADDVDLTASEEWGETVLAWIDRLESPASALRSRMAWFWHGVLTTSADSVAPALIAPQIGLLHRHALGNVRDLLQGFVIDGALLQYLDGDGSAAWDPNENLARELMELFTVGRGHYDQDDVRAAARALAGWRVEDDTVRFDRDLAFSAPLLFLGAQADWGTASVVDALCDHPATARRLGSILWTDLVGAAPDEGTADEIGDRFGDLEIEPLVRWICSTDAFAASVRLRPRTGFEWWLAARAAIVAGGGDRPPSADDRWSLGGLGQVPYEPPTVAGWARDDRWVSAGSLAGRLRYVWSLDRQAAFGEGRVDVDRVVAACDLDDIGPDSRAVLDRAAAEAQLEDTSRRHLVWQLALSLPEFSHA